MGVFSSTARPSGVHCVWVKFLAPVLPLRLTRLESGLHTPPTVKKPSRSAKTLKFLNLLGLIETLGAFLIQSSGAFLAPLAPPGSPVGCKGRRKASPKSGQSRPAHSWRKVFQKSAKLSGPNLGLKSAQVNTSLGPRMGAWCSFLAGARDQGEVFRPVDKPE